MHLIVFIMLIVLLPGKANAQLPGDFGTAQSQWQLTLDVIKAKAQTLLGENNNLLSSVELLKGQVAHLQQSIAGEQSANDQLRQLLKERKGKTDQQIVLEGVQAQLKEKKAALEAQEAQLIDWKKKSDGVERKINLQKLKISEMQLRQDQEQVQAKLKEKTQQEEPVIEVDSSQVNDLRKQLEEAKAQEVVLEKQLADFKNEGQGAAAQNSNIDEENKALEEKLEVLNKQKIQRQEEFATQANSFSLVKERYYQMKAQKSMLEQQIRIFEAKADALKQSVINSGLPWESQKKGLIHEMVQADAKNSQMREKINNLREDVGILQGQIKKMESLISLREKSQVKKK